MDNSLFQIFPSLHELPMQSVHINQRFEFKFCSGEVYSIQHYVIKFVSDLHYVIKIVSDLHYVIKFVSDLRLTGG